MCAPGDLQSVDIEALKVVKQCYDRAIEVQIFFPGLVI